MVGSCVEFFAIREDMMACNPTPCCAWARSLAVPQIKLLYLLHLPDMARHAYPEVDAQGTPIRLTSMAQTNMGLPVDALAAVINAQMNRPGANLKWIFELITACSYNPTEPWHICT